MEPVSHGIGSNFMRHKSIFTVQVYIEGKGWCKTDRTFTSKECAHRWYKENARQQNTAYSDQTIRVVDDRTGETVYNYLYL